MDQEQLTDLIAKYETETDLKEKIQYAHSIAGIFHYRLYDYEKAHQYLLERLQIAEQIPDEIEISKSHNLLGELFFHLQDVQRAEQAFHKAISIAEKLQNDTHLSRGYINLGMLFFNLSNYFLALEYLEKALKIAEKLQDHFLKAMAMTHVGRVYLAIDEYEKALKYTRRAFILFHPDNDQRISCYVNLGIIYGKLKDFALAIGYYKRVIPILQEMNNLPGVVEMYGRICELYIAQKKYDKVIKYARKAQDFIAEYHVDTLPQEDYICYLQLMFHYDTDDKEKTEFYIQKFITLNITNQEYLFAFYYIAFHFYQQQQRFEQAFEYLLKYHELYKIIFDEEMKKNMAIKTANFEYEQEKQRAELLHLKNEELRRLHDERDILVNTISHDFKNYLSAAQQALEVYTHKEKSLSENKYISIASSSINRSTNLIKEILYSIKTSASKDNLTLQTIDINDVIAKDAETLHLRGSNKDITVQFEFAPEPLMVQLDIEKWLRVFENLTTNAIKFTPSGNRIHISTKRDGNFALISIKDSGIGIAPENLSKLFTPFSGVGRKGTEGEESTGLGLSIVKKLVELHSGEIQVFSEVGKGTEFVVKLHLVP